MNTEFSLLLVTAAMLGVLHTVLGPDHYIPFVAMARARNWSNRKTIAITMMSGIGHVASSLVIGAIGLLFGIEVLKLEALESVRGDFAGWLLLGFGLIYALWGVRHALRKSRATHSHEGVTHTHLLHRDPDHDHDGKPNITPWIIFTVFVFGPCEPLIPVLMYPAARADGFSVLAVALTFSLCTIGTMSVMVWLALRGLEHISFRAFERFSHATAGFVIAMCGAGVTFLGM